MKRHAGDKNCYIICLCSFTLAHTQRATLILTITRTDAQSRATDNHKHITRNTQTSRAATEWHTDGCRTLKISPLRTNGEKYKAQGTNPNTQTCMPDWIPSLGSSPTANLLLLPLRPSSRDNKLYDERWWRIAVEMFVSVAVGVWAWHKDDRWIASFLVCFPLYFKRLPT